MNRVCSCSTNRTRQLSSVRVESGLRSQRVRRTRVIGTGTAVALEAVRRLQAVEVSLTPHAVLAGRVADDRGDPIAPVHVQAVGYRYNRGRKELTSFGRAVTNDLGEFRIFGLPPGRYYLSATPRSPSIVDAAPKRAANAMSDDDYVPTYYPRGTDPTFATMVEARPGAQLAGIDLALSKVRTVHLSGRVNNSMGSAMATILLVPVTQAHRRPFASQAGVPWHQ